MCVEDKAKHFVHIAFQNQFVSMPITGKQWRDQVSFSEGPWNTVWKLKVRLTYQKEK